MQDPNTINPEIEVHLIDHTQDAAKKLVFTKQTRLEMTSNWRERIDKMSYAELKEQLDYIANTIPSSWEFVNYTFLILNVTRAFTHQFVRTRTGSYAQQTMRMLDIKQFKYRIPPAIKEQGGEALDAYNLCMQDIQLHYDKMIDAGVHPSDARGVLPTNVCTNIVAQFNLRTLSDLAKSRTSGRVQDEYREVFTKMMDSVLEIHPWVKPFLISDNKQKLMDLEHQVKEITGLDNYHPRMIDIMKLIDQLKKVVK